MTTSIERNAPATVISRLTGQGGQRGLSAQNTSLADKAPMMLTKNFWFEWNGGTCDGVEAANK